MAPAQGEVSDPAVPLAGANAADPLREAAPVIDDVEARRARAAIEGRLFSGPPVPVTVGRYQIKGRIGAGGMGVVYRAHDPELARDVAVKLMNPEAIGDSEARMARARLVREARAMARLAHPNVIHVYDVGTVQDGVFIAMELVEGQSLSTWLGAQPRGWREVIRMLIDAGRGLAAAHAAGVVHRDFKPENVLLGDDGRVRVGDFGLAGAPAASEVGFSTHDEAADEDAESASVASTLTRTGALLGTPKYMAPEQEGGAPASARSDQFSFCVALYEALYGYPPFEGDTVMRYRKNVRHGLVLPPPTGAKVSAHVHADIVRGLAVDPAQRHPGMDVLLDALEHVVVDPRLAARRRRRVRVAALSGIAAAALAVGWGLGRRPEQLRPARAGLSGATPALMQAADAKVPETLTVPMPPPQKDGDAGAKPSKARPKRATTAKPGARRARGYCYFLQDGYKFLARSRAKKTFLKRGADCYQCYKTPASVQGGLTWPADVDCGQNRKQTCHKVSANKCES